jgi:cystathionine beta-lyase
MVTSAHPATAAPQAGPGDVSLELLRLRRSIKWRKYPDDVLPAFVAEMDFELAAPVRAALAEAVARSDTGYAATAPLGPAYAEFAAARYGWTLDPAHVRAAGDVVAAIAELVRALTEPGDGVVVNPPVYPPFFSVVAEVGRRIVEAPLARGPQGYELDLGALERAFAGGARAYLLCSPHNPSGRSFARAELEAVAELAERHGVVVIADEIHAPLTLAGAAHVPYASLGGAAAAHGVVVSGASKGWNIAGLKCAVVVSGSPEMDRRLEATLAGHMPYRVGHFGVLASIAAFEHGVPWLDAVCTQLAENRTLLAALLAEQLPAVGYVPPQAGYLAWLDFSALGLGDDPAAALLEHGRVALSSGPEFGSGGQGFARLNFATSPGLLAEAVRRVALGAADAPQSR